MTVEAGRDWESVKRRWGRHRSLSQGRGWVGLLLTMARYWLKMLRMRGTREERMKSLEGARPRRV